jgi:hypothetical protein
MKTAVRKVSFITALLLSFIIFTTVFAISRSLGGVNVTAVQTVTTDWDNWTATIYSTAASKIGTIGWTWYTPKEYCNGTGVYYPRGSRAAYNDNREVLSNTTDVRFACPGGTHRLVSEGGHDFKHPVVNPTTWRPLVTKQVTE